MELKIGQLRSVVQFKVNLPVSLGVGYTEQYFDYGQTRGCLKSRGGFKSGSRGLVSGEVEFNNTYELYIRYQPYYAKVDLLIEVEGRKFTIDSVENIEEGKKSFLMFILTEKK